MPTKQLRHNLPQEAAVLSKAVARVADLWSLKNTELSDILGVSEASISRLRAGHFQITPGSKAGELAILLIRLFRGLDAFMGGHEENQRLWLAAPNSALGAVPLAAIRRVEGLAYAVQYMDAMRGR